MRLHPKLGLNPRMGKCFQCGEDNGEVVLIGAHTTVGECMECHRLVYGLGPHGSCSSPTQYRNQREIGEFERIPSGLCAACRQQQQEHDAVVAAGGVYWRCDAGHSGVIKPGELAARARSHLNIPTGPCGVEFSEAECPACRTSGGAAEQAGSL